jgi:crossover junction endodeoxyribonuclease RusA
VRIEVIFKGQPVPTGRPRFMRTRKGQVWAYTPEKTRTYQRDLADTIAESVARSGGSLRSAAPFRVEACFYLAHRFRTDVDNLLKSVLDASTKAGVWMDDSQVLEVSAKVFRGQDDPRVEMILETIEGKS